MKHCVLTLLLIIVLAPIIQAQDNTDTSGKRSTDGKIFHSVETPPKFRGGKKALFEFLREELNYPEKAKENATEGTVVVKFVVDKKGNIQSPEITKGVTEELNQEALRVVKAMPQWKPGKQKGDKVRATFQLPIRFSLGKDE